MAGMSTGLPWYLYVWGVVSQGKAISRLPGVAEGMLQHMARHPVFTSVGAGSCPGADAGHSAVPDFRARPAKVTSSGRR